MTMTLPPLWPSSLPLYPNGVTGFRPQPMRLEFETQGNDTYSRPKQTARVDRFTAQFAALSKAQLEAFRTFHDSSLLLGSLTFAWVHPFREVIRRAKIVGEPQEGVVSGVRRNLSVQVEMIDVTPWFAANLTTVNGFIEIASPYP